MIKFVLMSIAAILVILGLYTYSNQKGEKSISTSPASEKKEEVKKTKKVSPPTQKATEKKSSTKNITVKSPKVIFHETTQEVEDAEEIGKDLTLEDIENALVSDEEKERMLDDLAYNLSLQPRAEPRLNKEEILKIIKEDLKNGLE